MDKDTVDTIYLLSEQIDFQLCELVAAISKMPPMLQNTYAVTSAAILLGSDDECFKFPRLDPANDISVPV